MRIINHTFASGPRSRKGSRLVARARDLFAPALAGVVMLSGTAHGAITGVTGNITQMHLPSVVPTAMQSNIEFWAFDEKQAYTLLAPISVNMDGSPITIFGPPGVVGSIPPGTVVDSHFIHMDPVVGGATLGGSVTFDKPIIGVQLLDAELHTTDTMIGTALGNPSTVYPTGASRRGLDWDTAPTEVVSISPDRRTITVTLTASNAIDQIRVITADVVPAGANECRLNEIYISHLEPADRREFIEIQGPPGADLTGLAVAVINGNAGTTGQLSRVDIIPPGTIMPADGYYVIGDVDVVNVDQVFSGAPALRRLDNFTNTYSLVWVGNPAGIAPVGTDLDANDDGLLDNPASIGTSVDSLSVRDGVGADLDYSPAVLGPDVVGPITRLPSGVFRPLDFPAPWSNDFFLNFDEQATCGNVPTPGAQNVEEGRDECGYWFGVLGEGYGGVEAAFQNALRVVPRNPASEAGIRYRPGLTDGFSITLDIPDADQVPAGSQFVFRDKPESAARGPALPYEVEFFCASDGSAWLWLYKFVKNGQIQLGSTRITNDGLIIVQTGVGEFPAGQVLWTGGCTTVIESYTNPETGEHICRAEFEADVVFVTQFGTFVGDAIEFVVDNVQDTLREPRVYEVASKGWNPLHRAAAVGSVGAAFRNILTSHMTARPDGLFVDSLDYADPSGVTIAPSSSILTKEPNDTWFMSTSFELQPGGTRPFATTGDTMTFTPTVQLGGVGADSPAGTITMTGNNAQSWFIDYNLSALGSPNATIEVVDQGQIVRRFENVVGYTLELLDPRGLRAIELQIDNGVLRGGAPRPIALNLYPGVFIRFKDGTTVQLLDGVIFYFPEGWIFPPSTRLSSLRVTSDSQAEVAVSPPILFTSVSFAAAPVCCPGDADGSGQVNFGDVTSALSNFGAVGTPGEQRPGDANCDGLIDFSDVTAVLANWLSDCL